MVGANLSRLESGTKSWDFQSKKKSTRFLGQNWRHEKVGGKTVGSLAPKSGTAPPKYFCVKILEA